MPHTLAEKILLAHTEADDVSPSEIVMAECDLVMANDVSGPVAFRQMEKMGVEKVFDPKKVVMEWLPTTSCRPGTCARPSSRNASRIGREPKA